MAKRTVYLESTIIGYAASKPSRDLVVAARQQITRDWLAGEQVNASALERHKDPGRETSKEITPWIRHL